LPAQTFLSALAPFRGRRHVGCECLFGCYWLSDLWPNGKVPFLFATALLYMKAIHCGKSKNDLPSTQQIARLLRAATAPAYVLPQGDARTRDLLRRLTTSSANAPDSSRHLQILNSQYTTLQPSPKARLRSASVRSWAIASATFSRPQRAKTRCQPAVIDCLDEPIAAIELSLTRPRRWTDVQTYPRFADHFARSRKVLGWYCSMISTTSSVVRQSSAISSRLPVGPLRTRVGPDKVLARVGHKIGNAPPCAGLLVRSACLFLFSVPRARPGVEAESEKNLGLKARRWPSSARLGRAVTTCGRQGRTFLLGTPSGKGVNKDLPSVERVQPGRLTGSLSLFLLPGEPGR